jgi:MinD superfamily P-loop ATPase
MMSAKSSEKKGADYVAVIDEKKCTVSGECMKICEVEAIYEGPKRMPLACLCAGNVPELLPGKSGAGHCCAILNSARLDTNIKETVQRSNYRAAKDNDKCTNCGECVRRCQVFAHTTEDSTDEKPVYHQDLCVGCGACVMGCKYDALHLEPVSEEEWFHVASSFTEWGKKRLAYLEAQKK